MTIPTLHLVGDKDLDAQVIRRAKRQVLGWRIRSLVLGFIAGLFFFKLRMVVPGVVFTVLAFGALQLSRLIIKRTVELQRKIASLEHER